MPEKHEVEEAESSGTTKQCTKCLEYKPLEAFVNHKGVKYLHGKDYRCRVCQKAYRANPEVRLRTKLRRLKSTYGLDEKAYLALLRSQRGVCAICKRSGHTRLVIDHCHESGQIRGILCNFCNTALGTFGDNSAGLVRAIEYLENFELTIERS